MPIIAMLLMVWALVDGTRARREALFLSPSPNGRCRRNANEIFTVPAHASSAAAEREIVPSCWPEGKQQDVAAAAGH